LTNQRAEIKKLVAVELERPQPPRGPSDGPVLPSSLRRRAQINALRTWQSAAAARLEDLRQSRTGEGETGRPIPAANQPQATRLMRRVVVRLSKTAATLATLEGAERRWHLAAKEARKGIQLRRDAARELLGAPLRPDARLHLRLAHATFMLEGNSPRLREELRDAVALNPSSKGLRYWLARYEMMAGRYGVAHGAVADVRDYAPVRNELLPMLEPESVEAPWLSWPCNFYTYRYPLAESEQLLAMQAGLAALASTPELEQTWTALGIPASAIALLKDRAVDAAKAVAALLLWNQANLDMTRSKYASARRNYDACQRTILDYFAARHPDLNLSLPDPPDESGSDLSPEQQLENALERLAIALIDYNAATRHIWTFFRERYVTTTIDELHRHDWRRPSVVPLAYEFSNPLPDYGEKTDFATAFARLLTRFGILKALQTEGEKVEEKIDAPLLAIGLVFCPMAMAEADRLRRHFDEALSQCRQLLRRHQQFAILSEVIEKPFVKILKAQILLDKADAQFKARSLATSPATNPDGSLKYQGLEAAETYQGVLDEFQDQGEYVNRVNAGLTAMTAELDAVLQHTFHPVAVKEATGPTAPPLSSSDRRTFALVGKKIPIPTIGPRRGEFPDPDRTVRPHERLLMFAPPQGESVLRETNPIVYALVVQARSRLLQMESGLNYLGYSDEYIPPWRFHFLLDRARYFAEHAKNAQREYLNFLSNAEREEFQEFTAAQNVEMEKSNVRIETARLDQARLEAEAAKQSGELATMQRDDAQARLADYSDFDERADEIDHDIIQGLNKSLIGAVGAGAFAGAAVGAAGGPIGALGGAIIGGGFAFFSASGGNKVAKAQLAIASEEREYEKQNLERTVAEAAKAEDVANAQLSVSRAGLLVAGMQRASALLRHEFAVQNLLFLRNRTLNAELWYRLSGAIRGVADTYLRYAIEVAFLAEQAYEFEADKRMDVVRFDYDISDVGDMLAGDFLLRDLDTLEQDLIVSQRLRQQQCRYVLSLARECPDAMQQLRETGRTTFALRLEQIERRFPGLFNVRVGSAEILPLALLDGSRFSLELMHLGNGQVRLQAQPGDTPNLNAIDWLSGVEEEWSVRVRTTGAETTVFSGLARQDLSGLPAFFAANQRNAFEGLAGASAWRVDFSAKENRLVPDTLADLLITFTLSGYYDARLRDVVDRSPRTAAAVSTWFSAHEQFPDAFYKFHQTGRMDWLVDAEALTLQGVVGRLNNVAVLCASSARRLELGRLMCSYPVEFVVDDAGVVRIARELPRISLTTNGLVLDATLNTPLGSTVTFDFGDGTAVVDPGALPHTYGRPGRYDVLIRIVANERLTEYRAAVVVSLQHTVAPPCVAVPDLQTTVNAGKIVLQPSLQSPSGEALSVIWRIDGREADSGSDPVTFTLDPGRYVLRFIAVRPLNARFYSQQRFDLTTLVALDGLRAATNRTFDTDGTETTQNLNAFGQHVFGAGMLSPLDRWTFELSLDDNPGAVSVSSADARRLDLSELADVFLALEYQVGDA